MEYPSKITILNTEPPLLEAFPVAQVLWPELRSTVYVSRLKSMTATGYTLFGCRSDGVLVGIAGVQEIEFLARGKILWLSDMAVHPAHRGKGLGKQLLDFLQDYAKSNGDTRLPPRTGANRAATIEFYCAQPGEPFGVLFRAVTGTPP